MLQQSPFDSTTTTPTRQGQQQPTILLKHLRQRSTNLLTCTHLNTASSSTELSFDDDDDDEVGAVACVYYHPQLYEISRPFK